MNAPATIKIAAVVMALYGLASIVGGTVGYLRAGSVASLAAGVPAGIVLLASALGVFYRPVWPLAVAIIVALLVGGFFASNLARHISDLGGFVRSSAGPRTIAMCAGALLVIITSAIALSSKPPAGP
jgi:uncharacterized membrane protein (UPF0136 family)